MVNTVLRAQRRVTVRRLRGLWLTDFIATPSPCDLGAIAPLDQYPRREQPRMHFSEDFCAKAFSYLLSHTRRLRSAVRFRLPSLGGKMLRRTRRHYTVRPRLPGVFRRDDVGGDHFLISPFTLFLREDP